MLASSQSLLALYNLLRPNQLAKVLFNLVIFCLAHVERSIFDLSIAIDDGLLRLVGQFKVKFALDFVHQVGSEVMQHVRILSQSNIHHRYAFSGIVERIKLCNHSFFGLVLHFKRNSSMLYLLLVIESRYEN